MKLSKDHIWFIALMILLIIAYLLGNSLAKQKPVDLSKWEQKIDSLEVLHQEALQTADKWKILADDNIKARDSLLLEYVKLTNKQQEIRYVKVYDSINTLGTSELQEYFTTRYPPERPGSQ